MTARIVLALLLAAPAAAVAADPPDLPPGKKLENELAGELVYHNYPGFIVVNAYSTEYTVALKAGTKITVAATVLGKDRRVFAYLKDPTGKVIGVPARGITAGASTFEVREVAATGKHTLVVLSDHIGAYTVKADYPSAKDNELVTEAGLREKIARLEKELAKAKEDLEAIRKK